MVGRSTLVAVLAGMGGFSDGFALLLGGAALLSLSQYFKLTAGAEGLIVSSPFIGSVVGSLIFGRLTDMLGRRAVFVNVLAFFVLGSLISALSYSVAQLIIGRLLVGIGIGGDIPSGASLIAEASSGGDRGRLISIQSILWGAGGAVAVLIALPLLALLGNASWRALLGLGAAPPLAALAMRRKIGESWIWRIKRAGGYKVGNRSKYSSILAFTAASLFAWTFMLAIFANYTPSILVSTMRLSKSAALLIGGLQWMGFVVGGLLVFKYCDSLGRRQLLVPATMGTAALLYAATFLAVNDPATSSLALIALWILGGVGYIINSIYSAELFPTLLRGTSNGISFSMGRLGGYISTLILPSMMVSIGLSGIMLALAIMMTPLALACLFMAPSSEGRSLEDLENI